MKEEEIVSLKFSEIKSVEYAIEQYEKCQSLYLELRLSSKQKNIPNFISLKKILTRNIARLLTYLNFVSIDLI